MVWISRHHSWKKRIAKLRKLLANLLPFSLYLSKKKKRRKEEEGRNHPRSEVSSAIGKWFNLRTRKVDSMTIPPPPTLCSERIEVDGELLPQTYFRQVGKFSGFWCAGSVTDPSPSAEPLPRGSVILAIFPGLRPLPSSPSKRILVSGRKSREKNRIDTSWTLEEIEKNRQTGKKIIVRG